MLKLTSISGHVLFQFKLLLSHAEHAGLNRISADELDYLHWSVMQMQIHYHEPGFLLYSDLNFLLIILTWFAPFDDSGPLLVYH